jgi:hypothetical protein
VCRWRLVLGTATVAALLLASLVAVGFWLRRTVHVSLSYCVEAQFSSLPKDDASLEEWLKTVPGVVPHTVSVRRFGPGRTLLEVGFIQSRDLAEEPPFPDLDDACKGLGYAGQDGPFRDCKDRHR